MRSVSFVILTIFLCGLVTWLSRVVPFVLLKKFHLPNAVVEYLSFVPVVIMSALWFENLFVQHLGSLPTVNVENLLASIPTVMAAVISKSLMVVVIVGIISLAVVRCFL